MQKLFSMFPRGAPGVALLLLRSSAAATLVSGALASQGAVDAPSILIPATLAIALLLGVLTPVVATLTAIFEVVEILHAGVGVAFSLVCVILNPIAIVMIGPGAYSLDARIFGRRVLEFDPRSKKHDG